MTSFFTSLRLLHLKQSELPHTGNIDCVKLSEKYQCMYGEYADAKGEYFQSQCSKCEDHSVKKNIKYVNKLFRSYKCLFISWDLSQPLILFFSNGSIVNMEFNDANNTLLKVNIDDNLCGKFLPSRIVDVVVCRNYVYVTYTEPKLTLIQFSQDSPSFFSKIFGRKKGKIVGFEPKFINFDLFVHSSKIVERKLSLNAQKDLLLIWWRNSSDDVWPWTPITYVTDRVNMLIYSVNGAFIELLYSIKVQDELLHATFSKQHAYQFFSVEEVKKENEVIVNVYIREIIHGHCEVVHSATLPVRGSLVASDWSSTEDKLLAADSNGLLLIYDIKLKSSVVANLEFIPKHLSWHPQNCIALIVCKNNQVLCYDAALKAINFKLCHKTSLDSNVLELSSYFPQQFSVLKVLWQKSAFNDTCLLLLDSSITSFLLLKFSFGSVTRHKVTPLEIISQYLKSDNLDASILLLRSLDWCTRGDMKFQCLSKIANCLFRKPLNYQSQAGLELALGAFYDWVPILPKRVIDTYEPRMHHLARRFFHHLLRYHKFRKTFLLAVDLESQDLFLDLYHVAKQKGENILAAVALRKAGEFDESSDSCSESCQSDSHSESATSSCNDISYSDTLHEKDSMEKASLSLSSNNPHASVRAKTSQFSLDVCNEQSSSNSFMEKHSSARTITRQCSKHLNFPPVSSRSELENPYSSIKTKTAQFSLSLENKSACSSSFTDKYNTDKLFAENSSKHSKNPPVPSRLQESENPLVSVTNTAVLSQSMDSDLRYSSSFMDKYSTAKTFPVNSSKTLKFPSLPCRSQESEYLSASVKTISIPSYSGIDSKEAYSSSLKDKYVAIRPGNSPGHSSIARNSSINSSVAGSSSKLASSFTAHSNKYDLPHYGGPTLRHPSSKHSDTTSSYSKDSHVSSSSITSTRDNCVIEEESEEVEGTQIKLAHLGII